MESKILTFLTVCQTMNYRKAAEILHLTQPAVTKQIQSLEQSFQGRLFIYDGHLLHKTENGILLEQYAISMQYNYEELLLNMKKKKRSNIRIGATKTIGDYVLGPSLIQYLSVPEHELSLTVANTAALLSMLDQSELDFAIIEGTFSKTKYGHYLFRNEPFVGACSIHNPLCGQTVPIDAITGNTLIIREKGSGTRSILNTRLEQYGYHLSDFDRMIPISSFLAIKQLVQADIGITFLYQSVIENVEGIGTFQIDHITVPHEFNVVYTKNSEAEKYAHLFVDEH